MQPAASAPVPPVPPVQLVPAEKLLAHEQVIQPRVDELIALLRKEGVIRLAVVADERTFVVLDGHHRFASLKALGCKRIPCILVDYHRADIRVATWREDEVAPTKEEVLARAKAGKLYVPKSTRHFFPWKLQEQPIKLSELK